MAERRGHQSWDGHRPYDSSCSSLPVKDSWNVQPKDIGQRRPERVIAKPWMEKKNKGGIAMLSLSPHSALIAGIVRLSIQESRVQTVGKMMKRLMVLQPQWCFDGIYQTVIIWLIYVRFPRKLLKRDHVVGFNYWIPGQDDMPFLFPYILHKIWQT